MYFLLLCMQTASADGDLIFLNPYGAFAPGSYWGTSVPQTPWASSPQMKIPCAALLRLLGIVVGLCLQELFVLLTGLVNVGNILYIFNAAS